MIPMKEDGSPDVEFIDKLPIDDYVDVIGCMNEKQLEYYYSHSSDTYEGPVIPIKVDYGFDDPRSGVDLHKLLEQMKRRIEKR